jgi:hypothetical protein
MDCIGVNCIDSPGDLTSGRQRQPQARIGWDRNGPKALGRQEFDFDPELPRGVRQSELCANYSVHLRAPGIGRDQDFHDAAIARAGKLLGGSTPRLLSNRIPE